MNNIAAGRVVLAKLDDRFWLVAGEDHLDALLLGELASDIAVELVPCASQAELQALWQTSGGADNEDAQPWALNPAFMPRVLGRLGLLAPIVQFGPWSAAIDTLAEAAIGSAAQWLTTSPGGALLLRQSRPEPAVAGQADLQRLRAILVRAALERAGIALAALQEETVRSEDPAEADRLHIVSIPAR